MPKPRAPKRAATQLGGGADAQPPQRTTRARKATARDGESSKGAEGETDTTAEVGPAAFDINDLGAGGGFSPDGGLAFGATGAAPNGGADIPEVEAVPIEEEDLNADAGQAQAAAGVARDGDEDSGVEILQEDPNAWRWTDEPLPADWDEEGSFEKICPMFAAWLYLGPLGQNIVDWSLVSTTVPKGQSREQRREAQYNAAKAERSKKKATSSPEGTSSGGGEASTSGDRGDGSATDVTGKDNHMKDMLTLERQNAERQRCQLEQNARADRIKELKLALDLYRELEDTDNIKATRDALLELVHKPAPSVPSDDPAPRGASGAEATTPVAAAPAATQS